MPPSAPKPPPGPYTSAITGPPTARHPYMVIKDANGRTILSVFGKEQERLALVDMVIEASKHL